MPTATKEPKQVSDLTAIAKREKDRFVIEELSNVNFRGGDNLTFGDYTVGVDEKGMNALSSYLGIPNNYLPKIPNDLRDDTVTHFLGKNPEAKAVIEAEGDLLLGMYPAERDLLPRDRVIDVVQNVFPKTAQLARVDLSNGQILVDVLTRSQKVEPRVGDITKGGIRFWAHISPRGTNKHPQLSTFMLRLMCENGMTKEEMGGNIGLRGNTVDEIIEEMETKARQLLDDTVEERLEQFASLDHVEVSNVPQLIHRFAREHQISSYLETSMIDQSPSLGEAVTLYDVVNFMTAFQHESRSSQFFRLQELGGEVAASHDTHRCVSCQREL